MKKQVTILSGLLLLTGAAFAQKTINVPVRTLPPATITPFNGIEAKSDGVVRAGGDIVWQDDFSGAHEWAVSTSGQGTFIIGTNAHAQISANQANGGLGVYMGNMASTTAANGFAFFNGVQYLVFNNVQAQNTSVASDTIDFTGISSVKVSFQQRYRAFNSDVTYVEFSADGGATWAFSEVVNADVATNASAVQNTINLNVPVNGTALGMIRFRWTGEADTQYGSGYGWMVDDVTITEGYDNNLAMSFTYSAVGDQFLQYSKFPVSQAASAGQISFGAEVKNVGNVSQNVALHVTSGSFDATGASVSIAPFVTDSVSIVTASGMTMPTVVGSSNFTFQATSNNTLSETSDDSKIVGFEVTNNTYAVDQYSGVASSMTGYFTNWVGGTGDQGIGTLYQIFEPTSVGSIDVGIGSIATSQQSTFNGREFFAQIYVLNGEVFDYFDEVPAHTLVSADYGKIVKLKRTNSTIPLDPGTYLVIATSYGGSPVPFAFAGNSIASTTFGLDGTDIVRLASDALTPNIVDAPVVRLDFQSYVGLEELENVTGITAAPNPFTNATEISFNVTNEAEVAIVVTDMAGRVVMTVPAANYAVGQHSVSLDGASLQAGVYNYTLKVGNSIVTKRIVKK